MTKPVRILYLEDRPEDAELVNEVLAREYIACDITWVNGREPFLSALQNGWCYDLLLVDFNLPDIDGDEALQLARERAPEVPFIFLAGNLGEEKAVECLRQGATDYVLKSNLPRLAPVVRRALEEARQAEARRRAEDSHKRVAALLKATLESTPEGILVVDLAGRVSAYNRKFLSLAGIPEYVMAPMDLDQVIQYLNGQFGDPGAMLEEARLLRARSDKESSGLIPIPGDRFLRASGRPHTVGAETVGRVLSFREAQEKELPGELLRTLGTGRQGFAEATMAGRVIPWYLVEDHLVMPEAAQALLGLASLPKDLAQLVALIHPEDADALREALERSQNVSFKARLRRADGAWAWTRWNVDRGPEGYRGVCMDITEQEWEEERILRRKRLEGAREMARRVAGRFHDHLRACTDDLRGIVLPPGQGPRLEGALAALREGEWFLAQLRSFAHQGRPSRIPVRFNEFLESLLPRLREGSEASLQFQPAKDLPEVSLDTAQIKQALTALVQNAQQALGGAGSIHVSTGLVYPRAYRPGGRPGPMRIRVFCEVRDTGPGIPPGIQKQVFEPFFTTRLGGGHTGLGLAIVEGIVDGHGGSLQLESSPGKGTAVRFLLPA